MAQSNDSNSLLPVEIFLIVKSTFDGLLIHKTPFQDRHLVGQLLLRSGKRVSVLFYGGMGGGKKMKVSGLEIGHLIQFQTSLNKPGIDLYNSKEWQVKWEHAQIRYNHQAFQLMCFYLEVARSLSGEDHLQDLYRETDQAEAGLFKVLSNGLFHLEKMVSEKRFSLESELILFLGKILIDQGLFPHRGQCCISGEEISPQDELALLSEQGGFAKTAFLGGGLERERMGTAGTVLWRVLGEVAHKKYHEIELLPIESINTMKVLWSYCCYQMAWPPDKFKTWRLLL